MSDCIDANVRLSPARESFLALSRQIFGLEFAPWDEKGYWTDRYRPYALVRDGQVVANASANIIDTRVDGVKKRYIQIGTVMCHPDFRGQGLMRRVMGALMADWQDRCDAMYLYGNDSVLEFYPKFGFSADREYIHSGAVTPCGGDFVPLDMDQPEGVALLRRLYAQGNPYSALPMLDNFGLIMFYCGFFLKRNVFYSPRHGVACVAEQEGDTLLLHDVFGASDAPLTQLIAQIAAPDTKRVTLGFTPLDEAPFTCAPLYEDDQTLFVLRGKENVFAQRHVRFPFLSHA